MSGEQWGEAVEAAVNALAAEFPKGALGLLTYGDVADVVVPAAAELIVADTRRKDRDTLIRVLFHHHKKTRTDSDGIAGRCVCGWGRPGDAFPIHIAAELDAAIARGSGNGGTA